MKLFNEYPKINILNFKKRIFINVNLIELQWNDSEYIMIFKYNHRRHKAEYPFYQGDDRSVTLKFQVEMKFRKWKLNKMYYLKFFKYVLVKGICFNHSLLAVR